MPLPIGALLASRYRITSVLGRGGMGTVFLATDENLGHPCAVKENLNLSPDSERLFRREASLLAGLRHRQLPRVTDHFVLDNQQYLVMDYVEGEDLKQRLERTGPLPERLVMQWAEQLCDALAYLHSLNPPIIHRDIKPANIKLTPTGEIMLVDFGLARQAASGDRHLTASNTLSFTPGFTPPEQYGLGHTDTRADQYALAATLYMLLTGKNPPDSVGRLLGNVVLIAPEALLPSLSPSVAAALTRALSLMPEDRFATIAAFRVAFYQAPPATKPLTPVAPSAVPPAQLAPQAGAPAAAATLLEPALPAVPRAAPPSSPAPLAPAAVLPPPPTAARSAPARGRARPRWLLPVALGCGLVGLTLSVLATSALGLMLARPTATARGGSMATGLVGAAVSQTARPLAASATPGAPPPTQLGQVETPSTAPSLTPPSSATAPPLGAPTELGQAPIGGGGRLAFISNRDGQFFQVYTMNVDGSDVRQVTTDPTDKWSAKWPYNGTQLAWSPDGRQLLYVANGEGQNVLDLWLIDADGGNPQDLTHAAGDDVQPSWCSDGTIWFASNRVNGFQQVFGTSLASIAQGLRPYNFSATHGSPREFDPAPYPGCERLMFSSLRGNDKAIWRYWPDCPECYLKVRTVAAEGGRVEEPALSPDGTLLAYTRVLSDTFQLMLANADDLTTDLQLTDSQRNYSAQWSPDGEWITFVSERDGNREVYIMTKTGDQQTNVSRNADHDTDPVWQPRAP